MQQDKNSLPIGWITSDQMDWSGLRKDKRLPPSLLDSIHFNKTTPTVKAREKVFTPELKDFTAQVLRHGSANDTSDAEKTDTKTTVMGTNVTEKRVGDQNDTDAGTEYVIHDEDGGFDFPEHSTQARHSADSAHSASSQGSTLGTVQPASEAPRLSSVDSNKSIESFSAELRDNIDSPIEVKLNRFLFDFDDTEYLKLISKDRIPKETVIKAWTDFHDLTRADSTALLLFRNDLHVCETVVSEGLDEITRRAFVLSPTDLYLDEQPQQKIEFRRMESQFHFKKRFSSDVFRNYEGLYLQSLQHMGVTGFLVLFYRSLPEAISFEEWEVKLAPILPLVLQLQKKSLPRETAVEEGLEVLSEISEHGKSPFFVLEMHLVPTDSELLQSLKKELEKSISDDDKLLLISPNRLILLMRNDSRESSIKQRVEQWLNHRLAVVKFSSLHYPRQGRNLYMYLSRSHSQSEN